MSEMKNYVLNLIDQMGWSGTPRLLHWVNLPDNERGESKEFFQSWLKEVERELNLVNVKEPEDIEIVVSKCFEVIDRDNSDLLSGLILLFFERSCLADLGLNLTKAEFSEIKKMGNRSIDRAVTLAMLTRLV